MTRIIEAQGTIDGLLDALKIEDLTTLDLRELGVVRGLSDLGDVTRRRMGITRVGPHLYINSDLLEGATRFVHIVQEPGENLKIEIEGREGRNARFCEPTETTRVVNFLKQTLDLG